MPVEQKQKTAADQAKFRCFGSKAGLTVEATPLLVKGVVSGETVNIDVAPRNNSEVIWSQKITLQLSETELPLMAAICLGYLPKVHFKRPDKGIVVERQANRMFISATMGSGKVYALPVPIGHVFHISTLILIQLQKHSLVTDSDLIIAALRGAAALYKETS